tara:strand:- start:5467 stop:5862 length:396 start_codon:yes stop_codon:yes gene_type:complete
MKKLSLIFFIFSFTVVLTSYSYAKWTQVGSSSNENTFYVDLDRITRHGSYVYFWYLRDFLKPNNQGYLSVKVYRQGDCDLLRTRLLSGYFYKYPMGKETAEVKKPVKATQRWKYVTPDSQYAVVLKTVCGK